MITRKTCLLYIFFFNQLVVNAFVHQKSPTGGNLKWPSNKNILLYVDSSNSSSISSEIILDHVSDSISQWSDSGKGPLIQVVPTNTNLNGRSDVYFTNNQLFFSSISTIAVTESIYSEDSGEIIESDILIKDSIVFSNDPTVHPFIGDVIAHEVGHFCGMDHSTLTKSSMFYKLNRGQHTLEADDLLGLNSLYGVYTDVGKITGKVAGSDNQTGIFAADVQLISSLEGRVIASTLSDKDGNFTFRGLPLNDVYYLYIKPVSLLKTLSDHYQTAKKDFCTGFSFYKGTFFESCDNGRRGFPHGVSLTSSVPSQNLGVITIKCNHNSPINYYSSRDSGGFSLAEGDKSGDSFIGFFTDEDILDQKKDVIILDLSHIDTSSGSFYLDLSLISQDFESKIAYDMNVLGGGGAYNFSYSVDQDTNPNLNLKGRIPLSPTASANVFNITIQPQNFDDFFLTTSLGDEELFFPDFSNVGDDRYFYQFIFFILELNGSGYAMSGHYEYSPSRGNGNCMEGEKTYRVIPAGLVSPEQRRIERNSDSELLSCGSIQWDDFDDDGRGGLLMALSFIIGLFLVRMFAALKEV